MGSISQQSARDGDLLASKSLIEQLKPDDADRLAVAPNTLNYQTLADRGDITDKAMREAGGIPVTRL